MKGLHESQLPQAERLFDQMVDRITAKAVLNHDPDNRHSLETLKKENRLQLSENDNDEGVPQFFVTFDGKLIARIEQPTFHTSKNKKGQLELTIHSNHTLF